MAKTRKARRGLVGYLYNPVRQSIRAVNNTARGLTKTAGKVVHNSLSGLNNVGTKVTRRADAAIQGLVPRGLIKRLTRRAKRVRRVKRRGGGKKRTISCDVCDGNGEVDPCNNCNGTGTRQTLNTHHGTTYNDKCEDCRGKGKYKCKRCGGSGTITINENKY
jgi:hypothetical protein